MAATPQPLPSVLVACRVRPFVSRSDGHESSGAPILELSGRTVQSRDPSSGRALGFGPFDALFGPASTQEEVFDAVAKDAVDSCLSGFNSTVFAYGQTGSGKTFTITGGAERYADRGIIPRSLQRIFAAIKADSKSQYVVRVSYLEIYNEEIRDLLADKKLRPGEEAERLELHENPEQGVYVKDLTMVTVDSVASIDKVMMAGNKLR
jgi:hypothetical protein